MIDAQAISSIVPFLKWAGGKRWLTSSYPEVFPPKFERYIEPFLGSGAVFFSLLPKRALLSDINGELISVYKALRENSSLVRRYLNEHHKQHSYKYYYEVRSSTPDSKFKRAARFIYLNRTCWNGLYRVNKKGEFNVPIGTKEKVVLDSDDFSGVERALRRRAVSLTACSFSHAIQQGRSGDFLFVDPPYTVNHNLNGFLKYNEKIFSWDDQEQLRDDLVAADSRGVKILMTNADHDSIRDLYESRFVVDAVQRSSVIAASSKHRKRTTELLIKNY